MIKLIENKKNKKNKKNHNKLSIMIKNKLCRKSRIYKIKLLIEKKSKKFNFLK